MARKVDPYETRARELATAAGVNPDDRVTKADSERGMPAWCTFRDAARKEHIATEQATFTPIAPQAEKYASAPLTIFGEHDQGTIDQMRNCMKVGNVVGGVLCADGHLGYAQPVGGVIAYDGQISVSGVGFDIGCFTGDTRIFTLDGKTPTLAEVAEREVFVLSCTPKGTPIPARGFCQKTRSNAELVKVTIDNGEVVRCTPDHLFMCRDGNYKRADELTCGQSLMPLYMTADRDGYVLVRNSATKKLFRLHYAVFRAGLTEPAPDDLDGDRLVLHHRNFVRWDNTPSNLQPMSKEAHDALHALMRDCAHFNTPEFTENRIAAIKRFWEGAREDQEFMAVRAERARRHLQQGEIDHPERFAANYTSAGQRGRSGLIAYNQSALAKENAARQAKVGRECPVCGTRVGATNALATHLRKSHPEIATNNHKVVSIERLVEREDVYCLTVPGLNNFGLASGVFVHNCGNMAVQLNLPFAVIKDRVGTILKDIARTISFGVGRVNDDERVQHPLFDADEAWKTADMVDYKNKAQQQLGTVGSGNHYVDLMRDEADYVWIGVHFGSRGLGHTSATKYLKAAGGQDGINVPPTVLDDNSELGIRYIAAMELAGSYAYAGREWVVERVRKIIGGSVMDSVHNHHNYAWREVHNGRTVWVVRKGATPAFPGQRGFVGGSMGDDCVILEGIEHSSTLGSLYSTVHGAGRLFGRKEAKRRFTRETMDSWLTVRGVHLIGADLDESPMAYRRLPDVLRDHAGTVWVRHILRPFGVVMAGAGEFDPFRD